MKFDFRVNPDYVFLHAISMAQPNEPFKGWAEFTNSLWEKSPDTFYFLAGAPEYILYTGSKKIALLAQKATDTLKQLRKEKPYLKLIQETTNYLALVQDQWNKNQERALGMLEELSGLSMPDKKITVFLTHPKLKNGMAVDHQTIVWDHPEDYQNYTTVYLCHELMHILTGLDDSKILHAVIELLVDNELRIRLNKKGKYFEYPGHKNLAKLEKQLLPAWKKYLQKKDKNVLSFVQKIKKELGASLSS